jgi:hypothetical protein
VSESSSCTSCPQGTISGLGESFGCSPCEAGKYANKNTSNACVPCEAGKVRGELKCRGTNVARLFSQFLSNAVPSYCHFPTHFATRSCLILDQVVATDAAPKARTEKSGGRLVSLVQQDILH